MKFNKKINFQKLVLSFIVGFLIFNSIFLIYLQYPCNSYNSESKISAKKYYPESIDIVYTWVNGSDEKLIEELNFYKTNYYLERNNDDEFNKQSNKVHCPFNLCGFNNHFMVSPIIESFSATFIDSIRNEFSKILNTTTVDIKFAANVNRSTFSRKSGIIFQSSISISKLFVNNSGFDLELLDFPLHSFRVSQIYIGDIDNRMGYPLDNHLFISGFPEIRDSINEDNWRQIISSKLPNGTKLSKVSSTGFLIDLPFSVDINQFNNTFNFTSLPDKVRFSNCLLIADIRLVTILSDISGSRFQDNEELKFSLRSLDKYFDFFRHIFIVTNGQIPSWLNTNHPKITVVSHREIFTNKSHLPTFNSAAIEANLYNIPGLATHFVYLNDDVFFGKKIYPEDFYSPTTGYKIYLGWSVPSCVEACPSSWLADGFCDHDCNVAECQWDGGDCIKTHGISGMVNFGKNINNSFPNADNIHNLLSGIISEFCSIGCNSNWLGDRYCDQSCNVDKCGYDIGDCGDVNILKLPSNVITEGNDEQSIMIPNDTRAFVLDFRQIISLTDNVTSATIDDLKVVLASSYAIKYRLLIIVFNHLDSCKDCYVKHDQIIRINITISKFNNSHIEIPRKLVLNCEKLCHRMNNSETTADKPSNIIMTTDTAANMQQSEQQQHKYQNLSFDKYSLKSNISIETLEWENPLEMSQFRLLLHDGLISLEGYRRLINGLWLNRLMKKKRYINFTAFNDIRIEKLSWGFLPWEKKLNSITLFDALSLSNTPSSSDFTSMRRTLDLYADSLRHSNNILSDIYSVNQRRVPAHGPHFINTSIFLDSRQKFYQPWLETSAHRFRSPNDVQFAFMYFHYLMNENISRSLTDILSSVDTDQSGSLNRNELRTLALIFSPNETAFVRIIDELFRDINVSCNDYSYGTNLHAFNHSIVQLISCINWTKFYQLSYVPRYSFTLHEDTELAFIMISSNHKKVLKDLDGLRKTPKKFFCLNDNLVNSDNPKLVTKIRRDVHDFLHFMFPNPSQFEIIFDHTRSQSSMQKVIIALMIFLIVIVFLSKRISTLLKNCRWTLKSPLRRFP